MLLLLAWPIPVDALVVGNTLNSSGSEPALKVCSPVKMLSPGLASPPVCPSSLRRRLLCVLQPSWLYLTSASAKARPALPAKKSRKIPRNPSHRQRNQSRSVTRHLLERHPVNGTFPEPALSRLPGDMAPRLPGPGAANPHVEVHRRSALGNKPRMNCLEPHSFVSPSYRTKIVALLPGSGARPLPPQPYQSQRWSQITAFSAGWQQPTGIFRPMPPKYSLRSPSACLTFQASSLIDCERRSPITAGDRFMDELDRAIARTVVMVHTKEG